MATKVLMKNPTTGQIKKGLYGFSWTYLIFGWWVPLLRGEVGIAALHLLFTIVTFGLWQFIVAFLYNKQFMGRLLEKGFVFSDTQEANAWAAAALSVDLAANQARAQIPA